VVWFRGVRLPRLPSGIGVTVADRLQPPPFRDVTLPADAVDRVAGCLRAAGLPDRAPIVEGIVDTSDVWQALRVTVAWNDRPPITVIVEAMSSGYRGPDAALLRALVGGVQALVGGVPG
jgi:hypothetical protein